jgi:hypothetical protein
MEPPYDAVPIQQALWWHPVHMHPRSAVRRVEDGLGPCEGEDAAALRPCPPVAVRVPTSGRRASRTAIYPA